MSEPLTFNGVDPKAVSPVEAYRILLNCVAPRPIAFTSTLSRDGIPNLAPFSFFMAGGANPPSIIISPTTTRDGSAKHTLRNIAETGEFVINVVTFEIAENMNITSADFPDGISEWEPAGLTPASCQVVKPNRVAESPLALECKLHQIVHHGTGAMSANYVIGEVVYFHIATQLLNEDELLDPTKVDYVARMGGNWYTRATPEAMFELGRP